jgi:hypothetical protein
MKPGYLNSLTSSFFLWLDHTLLEKGRAFKAYTGSLYSSEDPKYGSTSSVYASPFKQFIYDSSVSGTHVSSGINNNGVFIPKSSSGLCIDYMNGRVIFENQNIVLNNPTINTFVKEINLYYTDEKEETLLFEKSQPLMSAVRGTTDGIKYNDLPYPCIFIKNTFTENRPFAFGGQDKTNTDIRCIALSQNSFQLDAIISLLNDCSRKNFPILQSVQLPFNHLGDFKSSPFNYKNLCAAAPLSDYVYIDNVIVSKLDEVSNAKINKKCTAAIVDFEVSSVRYPRV